MRVFLSYRRSDVGGHAGRLTDAMVQRLGPKNVFHDVSAIAPGEDFNEAINRALDASDAMLAVIGPGWLTASSEQGERRLTRRADYVRRELTRALERNAVVIPVLVGGARLPLEAELPAELRGLVHRQGVTLHDETWHQDVEGLLTTLQGESAVEGVGGRRRVLVPAALAVLLLTGTGVAAWQLRQDNQSSSGDPPACAPSQGPGWSSVSVRRDASGAARVETGVLRFE